MLASQRGFYVSRDIIDREAFDQRRKLVIGYLKSTAAGGNIVEAQLAGEGDAAVVEGISVRSGRHGILMWLALVPAPLKSQGSRNPASCDHTLSY